MTRLPSTIRRLESLLRRLRRDERGIAAFETILLMPILMWGYVAMFVMFDAYKVQTDGLRVTYSVADAMSRELDPINQSYLDSMVRVSNFMTRSPQGITQRVSIVCFSDTLDQYRIAWSKTTGPNAASYAAHQHVDIDQLSDQLPSMPSGDQAILIETFMKYRPLWNIGISEMTFDYFVVTRPRFTNQVRWDGQEAWVCSGT